MKKDHQKQQRLFQQAEKLLAEMNEKKALLENKLSSPDTYSNPDEFKKTEGDYKKASEEWVRANAQYESVFEQLMKLEEKLSTLPPSS